MNVGSVLTEVAHRHPRLAAIRSGDLARSFAEWDERANRFASALEGRGVGAGDRVVLLQQNGPALLESLLAVLKLGAVAVPVNAKLHPEEYAFIVRHCEASSVVFSPDFAPGLEAQSIHETVPTLVCTMGEPPAWAEAFESLLPGGDPARPDTDREPDDTCWLFYTSGTTGRPKGAMITHGNLDFMVSRYPLEVRRPPLGEVVLHLAPLTHAGGLWGLPLIAAGACQVIPDPPQFDPAGALALVGEVAARQIVFVAPTMLTMLLDAAEAAETAGTPFDISSLDFIGYGGSPAYTSELRRAIDRFGPVLCQIYGQGECPMTITMLAPEDHRHADPDVEARRLTSAGRRRDGIEVEIVSEDGEVLPAGADGEVCVRGPVVMAGYWHSDEATSEAFAGGWYHTGDVGRFDEDGFLHLFDRLKDLIISGGSNIYGREVEDVLTCHPGVREAAVIGLAHPTWGETVTAVVVADGEPPSTDELAELCLAHLAGFKKPRRWYFVESLPKNAYGKVLKRELREQLAAIDPSA